MQAISEKRKTRNGSKQVPQLRPYTGTGQIDKIAEISRDKHTHHHHR